MSDADKVISHTWNIGAVTSGNNDLATQITDEKGTTWNGKIGLITASEYLRANDNIEQCGTISLNYENQETCYPTNWMLVSMLNHPWTWTISAKTGNSYDVLTVNGGGTLVNSAAIYANSVVPALYLTSDIILTGSGTSDDPYIITN